MVSVEQEAADRMGAAFGPLRPPLQVSLSRDSVPAVRRRERKELGPPSAWTPAPAGRAPGFAGAPMCDAKKREPAPGKWSWRSRPRRSSPWKEMWPPRGFRERSGFRRRRRHRPSRLPSPSEGEPREL